MIELVVAAAAATRMPSREGKIMTTVRERIKDSFGRTAAALSRRPEVGQRTSTTHVRLVDGLSCQIEEGPWTMTADMPTAAGGDASGPTPGALGRAALGSCLAIGYAMWAAEMDVPIDNLEVEVEADYDLRGLYGVADVTPGYTQLRYTVRVESNAPKEDVMRVLDTADAHSPELSVRLDKGVAERSVEIAETV